MKINSNEYWDHRFDTDWLDFSGDKQSIFFAKILIDSIPKEIISEINSSNMSVADWGCALGDGTDYFSKALNCDVTGIDFSSIAIEQAKKKYAPLTFISQDWLVGEGGDKFDVLISSNTLEHFHSPYSVLNSISKHANKMVILALPFEEKDRIEEHHFTFEDDNIPCFFGEKWVLSYSKIVDCSVNSPCYWDGKQIVLIYSNITWLNQKQLPISSFGNVNELADNERKLQEKKLELLEQYDLNTQMENSYKSLKIELLELKSMLSSEVEEVENLTEKLQKKSSELLEQYDLNTQMENSHKSLKIELLELKSLLKSEAEEVANLTEKLNLSRIEISQFKSGILYKLSNKLRGVLVGIVQRLKVQYKKLPYSYRVKISKFVWFAKRTDVLFYRIKEKVKKIINEKQQSNVLENYIAVKNDNWNISGDLFLIQSCFTAEAKSSYMLFPVIDWHFRVQRPQHICRELGRLGSKVIYFTTTFNLSNQPGFKVLESPEENVIICQLNLNIENISIYHDKLNNDEINFLIKSVNSVRATFNLGHTNSLINLPFWTDVSSKLSGNTVIYDCMDHHAGFENNSHDMLNEENKLLDHADLVITTAAKLSDIISEKRENVIIRNAAEVEFFAKTETRILHEKKGKTIGYYGAIAEWFDLELLRYCATQTPDYEYLIIGNVTVDLEGVDKLNNVTFIGEVPYSDLPAYLNSFDVCLIPFKLIELTLCTNPVKVYEYLAAGKPVVATAMPEVVLMSDYVHIGNSPDHFVNKIKLALDEINDIELSRKRSEWALTHDWSNRANDLNTQVIALDTYKKKISLIVLTYNNLHLTKDCLQSIENNTYYENYEVIIVDNDSTDGTKEYLTNNFTNNDKFKIVLNDENVGFAAGNNIGLKQSSGDIIVIINNDTHVAPYWLSSIVRAFEQNENLGLACPITNNIGNEAKINVTYSSFNEMNIHTTNICSENSGRILKVDSVAFFCAAMRRNVYQKVGDLCEEYGLGFFEDDDYCKRVKQNGWDIAVIDDSFVHHHLSASFNKLGDNKKELLIQTNKEIFESKWGSWKPHSYRPGVY